MLACIALLPVLLSVPVFITGIIKRSAFCIVVSLTAILTVGITPVLGIFGLMLNPELSEYTFLTVSLALLLVLALRCRRKNARASLLVFTVLFAVCSVPLLGRFGHGTVYADSDGEIYAGIYLKYAPDNIAAVEYHRMKGVLILEKEAVARDRRTLPDFSPLPGNGELEGIYAV